MKPRHARALLWTVITTGWLFILFGLAWVNSAKAQFLPGPVCGERDAIASALASTYHEKPVAIGLVSNGTMLEVFASREGTFTILMTEPTGRSCMITAGESWEMQQEPAY